MKSTVVDESLSSFKPMYCSREYQASTRLSQQYEKSTPNTYECVAFDSKKDDYTELTTIDVSLKPQKTGNLRKVLHVKVGARVMLTTNIN